MVCESAVCLCLCVFVCVCVCVCVCVSVSVSVCVCALINNLFVLILLSLLLQCNFVILVMARHRTFVDEVEKIIVIIFMLYVLLITPIGWFGVSKANRCSAIQFFFFVYLNKLSGIHTHTHSPPVSSLPLSLSPSPSPLFLTLCLSLPLSLSPSLSKSLFS